MLSATAYREICLLSVTVICNSVFKNTGMFGMLYFLFYMSEFLKFIVSKRKCTNSKEQIEAAEREPTSLDQECITFAKMAEVAQLREPINVTYSPRNQLRQQDNAKFLIESLFPMHKLLAVHSHQRHAYIGE